MCKKRKIEEKSDDKKYLKRKVGVRRIPVNVVVALLYNVSFHSETNVQK